MIWIALYVVLGLAVGGFLVLFARRVRTQEGAKRLSLADYISVASTILNVVLLVIAVVSLHIASNAYFDAKKSGEKQELRLSEQQKSLDASRAVLDKVVQALGQQLDVLEKSKDTLDSSVLTSAAQQKLLAQNVVNSKKQLTILQAEWQRELEQPDVHAALLYPQDLAIVLSNSSKVKPVKQGLYQLIMFNIDRPVTADHFQLVQTTATAIDFIPPAGAFLPSRADLLLQPNEPLVKGNRLFGYLSISCAECSNRRAYWVFIKYGEAGWYRELKDGAYPFTKLRPDNIERYVSDFMNHNDPIEIPKSPQ
jgi:hypothetical protein